MFGLFACKYQKINAAIPIYRLIHLLTSNTRLHFIAKTKDGLVIPLVPEQVDL